MAGIVATGKPGEVVTVRIVGDMAVRCDLMDVVEVVAEVVQDATDTPPSAATHSLASALRETPVTLCEDGDASVESPSALLALPAASSDFRPELGEDGETATDAAL